MPCELGNDEQPHSQVHLARRFYRHGARISFPETRRCGGSITGLVRRRSRGRPTPTGHYCGPAALGRGRTRQWVHDEVVLADTGNRRSAASALGGGQPPRGAAACSPRPAREGRGAVNRLVSRLRFRCVLFPDQDFVKERGKSSRLRGIFRFDTRHWWFTHLPLPVHGLAPRFCSVSPSRVTTLRVERTPCAGSRSLFPDVGPARCWGSWRWRAPCP